MHQNGVHQLLHNYGSYEEKNKNNNGTTKEVPNRYKYTKNIELSCCRQTHSLLSPQTLDSLGQEVKFQSQNVTFQFGGQEHHFKQTVT